VVDPEKNNQKKWRAKEEERHKRSLTHKKLTHLHSKNNVLSTSAQNVRVCYLKIATHRKSSLAAFKIF
jgi:hypothetical protein